MEAEKQIELNGKLYSRSYLIEHQAMHLIKKQEKRLKEIEEMRAKTPYEITDADYWAAFYLANGAITQLMICLSCYDNPQSNFLAEEEKERLAKEEEEKRMKRKQK